MLFEPGLGSHMIFEWLCLWLWLSHKVGKFHVWDVIIISWWIRILWGRSSPHNQWFAYFSPSFREKHSDYSHPGISKAIKKSSPNEEVMRSNSYSSPWIIAWSIDPLIYFLLYKKLAFSVWGPKFWENDLKAHGVRNRWGSRNCNTEWAMAVFPKSTRTTNESSPPWRVWSKNWAFLPGFSNFSYPMERS